MQSGCFGKQKMQSMPIFPISRLAIFGLLLLTSPVWAQSQPMRVFIFAGQSNMVGTHARVEHIHRFPPFVGLENPQAGILYSYKVGREEMEQSTGWIELQPTRDFFGPELSFGRRIAQGLGEKIAIIKIASGGTTLAEDWDPDHPRGFKLYPLALKHIRESLAELDRLNIPYRVEGFMWHQGENDMFNPDFRSRYAKNLKRFIACWRRDLQAPELQFYIGELCTKTVWGMDNRDNMHAIRIAQKAVVAEVPGTQYVPTSHDAVEIGGDEGLHYHYGTLGQLEHGENYAAAYLRHIHLTPKLERVLPAWPYEKGSLVKLFILAGHRNMEGERAFVGQLKDLVVRASLANDNPRIALKYSLGGGFKESRGWEPLGPAGMYESFGPELSFASAISSAIEDNIAIAKFTHSGSQMIDWTPEGSRANDLNLYPKFLIFVRNTIQELEANGNRVEVAGVFYHLGENDMAYQPYRKKAASWLKSTVEQCRSDLSLPQLKWFVSQQLPPDENGLAAVDVVADIAALADADPFIHHIKAFDLPPQKEKLVLDTAGVLRLGELMAGAYLEK